MYEILTSTAHVDKILKKMNKIDIVRLENGEKAINYRLITGNVDENDLVVLNTTAQVLALGTGGYNFIICNLNNLNKKNTDIKQPGHIMKIRYTPQQIKTMCVEEEKSPYHDKINKFKNLAGKTVVILPLHSLLAPLAVVFKKMYPLKKFVYIMTDGGSLPIDFSFLVQKLKEKKLIDKTITSGHCFGGELETVNIFTGLAAAAEICEADLIAVGMGPGIAGTGTKLGYSGVENAFINYAVNILGGKSLIVPRISLAEKRKRHYLISHHTVTLLTKLIKEKVTVIFPLFDDIIDKVRKLELEKLHNIVYYDYTGIEEILINSEIKFNSMGRNFTDDPLFFISGGLPVLKYKEYIEE